MKMALEDGLMGARRVGRQRPSMLLDLLSLDLRSSTPQTEVAEHSAQGLLVKEVQDRLGGQSAPLLCPSPPLHRVALSLIGQQHQMLYPCPDVSLIINKAAEVIPDSNSAMAMKIAHRLIPTPPEHQDLARLLAIVQPVP